MLDREKTCLTHLDNLFFFGDPFYDIFLVNNDNKFEARTVPITKKGMKDYRKTKKRPRN